MSAEACRACRVCRDDDRTIPAGFERMAPRQRLLSRLTRDPRLIVTLCDTFRAKGAEARSGFFATRD